MEQVPLLDPEACRGMSRAVIDLRPHWIKRHPEAPFFTLGAASYLDASGPAGLAPYSALSDSLNPLLDSAFKPLFDLIVSTLQKRLQAPVQLAKHQARPGFHVFLSHPAFQQPVAQVHCDLQHRLLNWEGLAPTASLSFTLPVALPPSGGGMDVWPIEQDAWLAMTAPERKEALSSHMPATVPYTLGSLVLHSGELVHRIQATPKVTPHDERITLQGHGVCRGGTWHLYW